MFLDNKSIVLLILHVFLIFRIEKVVPISLIGSGAKINL